MISQLYSPDLYKQTAQVISDEIAKHLAQAQSPDSGVVRAAPAPELIKRAQNFLGNGPAIQSQSESLNESQILTRARAMAQEFLNSTTHLHSPRYMGHQVNPPVPVASAFQALGAVMNPGLAVYEMSQFASAIERALIAKLLPYVGWDTENSDGVITSGGTLANLTAILTARNWKYPSAFAQGLAPGVRPAILVSADCHYSLSRAAGVLGFGTEQVIKVPINEKRQLRPELLDSVIKEVRSRGLDPFCIVAACGSTPFGAFDPLLEIADFAEREGLWLHVDGAHGGGLLLSDKHRHLLKGIEEADSVTWDAHKMMFVPSLCTFLLYRDRSDSYRTFQQDAPYIFGADQERLSLDAGLRTFECTKGPIALPVWALWSLFGEKTIAHLIESVIKATREFFELVKSQSDFTALHEPECNIFCFRYTPAGTEDLDSLQRKIREQIVQDGQFYSTGTVIDGVYSLRVTVINPHTRLEHFRELLEKIRESCPET